jgi:hypothetical protein
VLIMFRVVHTCTPSSRSCTLLVILLRLSDDERFTVELGLYPQWATAISSQDEFFSPAELKVLMAFAKQHDIVIIPEIQLAIRVASWAQNRGLIMACLNFNCKSVPMSPLNLKHDDLTNILEDIPPEI